MIALKGVWLPNTRKLKALSGQARSPFVLTEHISSIIMSNHWGGGNCKGGGAATVARQELVILKL